MMYYRMSKNEKFLFFGKKIAQVWAVTLTTLKDPLFQTSEMLQQLSLCSVELVELLPVH